jgi:hypothetical protein
MWEEPSEAAALIGGYFMVILLILWLGLLSELAQVPIFLLTFLFLAYLVGYADKRWIGVVGGILVLVSFFFMTWVGVGGTSEQFHVSGGASGWDITQGKINVSVGQFSGRVDMGEGESYPYLALIGGTLAIIGGVGMIAFPKIKELAVLPVMGGILAFVGALWGLVDIGIATEVFDLGWGSAVVTISFGLGLILTLFVGPLCLAASYNYFKKMAGR